ncbi:hypothetical protein [Saccharothrix sp. NRRL B-16314]|uniref:hypothetical protein n=1 Tax=Saccharothrix sp. NRRL B-16314 TaxID=1463825 RepID=UPI0005258CD0|nr:hypothetical protein [Saccharothrix sp. NRRL B-16314]
MASTGHPAALPDDADGRRLFGDEVTRRFGGRERELLPPQARPAVVRWTWLALAVVLSALVGVAVAIGAVL